MTGACTIRDPKDTTVGNFDPATGTYPRTPAAPYFTGACRAQQQRQPQEASTGGEEISNHDYLVTVPASVVSVEIGHVVKVTAAVDASLVGRVLQITDVQRGTEIWERDLICIDWLG